MDPCFIQNFEHTNSEELIFEIHEALNSLTTLANEAQDVNSAFVFVMKGLFWLNCNQGLSPHLMHHRDALLSCMSRKHNNLGHVHVTTSLESKMRTSDLWCHKTYPENDHSALVALFKVLIDRHRNATMSCKQLAYLLCILEWLSHNLWFCQRHKSMARVILQKLDEFSEKVPAFSTAYARLYKACNDSLDCY